MSARQFRVRTADGAVHEPVYVHGFGGATQHSRDHRDDLSRARAAAKSRSAVWFKRHINDDYTIAPLSGATIELLEVEDARDRHA